MPDEPLICSFCGKSQGQVKMLIAGPGAYICNECVALCAVIVEEQVGADWRRYAPPNTDDFEPSWPEIERRAKRRD